MEKNRVSLKKTEAGTQVEGANTEGVEKTEPNRGTYSSGFTLQTLVFAIILNIGLVTLLMHFMSKR